jgi:Protein of unknown function DUF262
MKKSRTPKIAVPKTREEIIEDSLNRLRDRRPGNLTKVALPGWPLHIGQSVQVGHLNNCVIYDVYDEGREIVIEYTHTSTRDNSGVYQCWGAWYWFDVFPVMENTFKKPQLVPVGKWNSYYSQTSLDSLMNRINNEYFRDNPDYQRGYVWTHENKLSYIDSIFKEHELGKFIWIKFPYPDVKYEVLDGKQRINAIREFIQGKWQYKDMFYWQLNRMDRHIIEDRIFSYAELDVKNYTRSELLKIFLDVNVAGVPQTEEHLAKVFALYQQALKEEQLVAEE